MLVVLQHHIHCPPCIQSYIYYLFCLRVGWWVTGSLAVCCLLLLLLLLQVGQWLTSIGLPQYKKKFKENAIDGAVLIEMGTEDLDYLDIKALGSSVRPSVRLPFVPSVPFVCLFVCLVVVMAVVGKGVL